MTFPLPNDYFFPLPNDYFPTVESLTLFVAEWCPDYVGTFSTEVVKEALRRLKTNGHRVTEKALERAAQDCEQDLRLFVKAWLAENQRSLSPDEVYFMGEARRFAWVLSSVIRPHLGAQLVARYS